MGSVSLTHDWPKIKKNLKLQRPLKVRLLGQMLQWFIFLPTGSAALDLYCGALEFVAKSSA
jgi:hypothetical protein